MPPCDQCSGACCRQRPGYAIAVELAGTELERFSGVAKYDPALGVVGIGFVDGRCPFLTEADRCSVYEERPALCREFDCRTGYGKRSGNHSFFLEDHPEVIELIELGFARAGETK